MLPLSETFVRQQALHLRDWRATLVGQRLCPNGLSLEGLDYQVLDLVPASAAEALGWRLYRRLGWPMPAALSRLMAPDGDGERPAVAHVHFATDAVQAWPWLKGLGLPVAVTLHGYDIHTRPDWWESGQGGEHMRDYPQRLRAMAQDPRVSFIAVSEAVRAQAIAAYGIDPEKLHTLFIGVDTQAFSPSGLPAGEREPHILFVGRQVEKKGLEVLIRAMSQVHQRFPQARVKVVGDGPLRERMEALAQRLDVPVDFLGAQPSHVVRELLATAKIFCLPSVVSQSGDAEGLPISILEAQACGVPVVTSAMGGRDEGIEPDRSGFAFPEGDPEALAAQLNRLLGDPALCNAMGRAARELATRKFDIQVCQRALESFYSARAGGAR
ncbi:Glycosyltransferase involved in cell wall bisynthesis [Roseateles sp. YR242]|uniref:glycosyltransferase n=1 Tax=Roseateles sp. YR242 TaxID=1855305 RepID=UPI0008AB05A8|nr:glycosyltransferase [Roseateles sp. YR242]SEK52474.1 Glycosyltransferase involved in cell wall bisynthesis [Roseateles sp. YR242]